ncbi:MAG: EVE domain-containing protein [Bacteroidales bacterium]|nr:EVE domain-containing protein [Bacteroidales bacterium]
MKLGDLVLFYHSQTGQSVLGKMIVIEEVHQDKTTDDTRWVSVTFEPVETFQNPIALELIKEQKELQNIGLIKQPRLSVMPLELQEFDLIIKLASINKKRRYSRN